MSEGVQPTAGGSRTGVGLDVALACALAALSVALYLPCADFGFVEYDDNLYVTDNALVQRGLTPDGVAAAFGFADGYSWLPLTLLSHMLDVSLFGLEPAGHHMVNVVLHALNAALVFWLLARATCTRVRALVCALIFALHPLQVESVAWVAERKNVLSTLLLLSCLAAYGAYARAPSAARYLTVCALFVLGLMAKPMLVTLPVLLLLVDVWPLERLRPSAPDAVRTASRLALEKLPLLGLAAAVAAITMLGQAHGGAMDGNEVLSLTERLVNAALSVLRYPHALLFPTELSIQYPHPYIPESGGVAPLPGEIAAVVGLAIAVTVLVAFTQSAPLVIGWLWYLVALLPVIGLIQVGRQGWADRYGYVPLLGVMVLLVWGAAQLLERARSPALGRLPVGLALAAAAVWLGSLAVRTHAQQQHWRDTLALASHGVRVSPRNARLHQMLGQEWKRRGELEKAAEGYYQAVQLAPDAATRSELGSLLLALGHTEAAIAELRRALATPGAPAEVRVNLANALVAHGDRAEGIALLRAAVAADPKSHVTAYNLGNALAEAGQLPEAIEHYRRVLAVQPDFSAAAFNLGNALAMQGDLDAAIAKFRELRARDPSYVRAQEALERALALKEQRAQ